MKLYAGRARDLEDMVAIWSSTGFAHPVDAVQMFWLAYPHAPEDEFLLNYVEEVKRRANSSRGQ